MVQARNFLAVHIHVVAFLAMSHLAGCLGGEEPNSSDDDTSNPPVPGNSAPQISGNPVRSLNFGSPYLFTPNASDPDGDSLTFDVANLPVWAGFEVLNGQITGTPLLGHVGTYSDIAITVSDGAASATLGPFTITVNANSNGSVTLSWTPPTQNEDGSMLMDLAGFKIYWGTAPGSYPNSVTINNASISTYVVDNLAPGTYEFVAASFNMSGVESRFSNSTTKIVP